MALEKEMPWATIDEASTCCLSPAAACKGDSALPLMRPWHHADRGPGGQEETASRIAWAAVNDRYRKIGEFWIEK